MQDAAEGANSKLLELSTWKANVMSVPVGFTKEHMYLEQTALPSAADADTLKGTIMASGSSVLLPSIKMEVEVR